MMTRGPGGGHGHGGGGFAPMMTRGPGGGGHGHGGGHQQARAFGGGQHGHGGGHQQARAFAGGGHGYGGGHQQARAFAGGGGHGHGGQQAAPGFRRQQAQIAQRQHIRGDVGGRAQQQAIAQQQNALAARNRGAQFAQVNNDYANAFYGNGGGRGVINGCPPGLAAKNNGCMPPGQAQKLLGAPLATAQSYGPMYALPQSLSYLYPETPDYYYRYGDGYLYQVDRTDNLIASLIPLLAGGYMPGQYLPAAYMQSYVPDYYGFNSFYPASYSYGGNGYDNLCNRYGYGVVYQVDCYSGMVVNVVPLYAGGYGVGQMLPTAYSYYNVPVQYRSVYYDTPDYNYWYAPGAIYQYDPRSSMITSVAALLSPGFTVGQQLPMGYDVYNVPYAYRATYYDSPTAWYRYNNGYIYQVDPTTMLVTAVVASLLNS